VVIKNMVKQEKERRKVSVGGSNTAKGWAHFDKVIMLNILRHNIHRGTTANHLFLEWLELMTGIQA